MTRLGLLQREVDGRIELSSPGVGYWREAPAMGSLVTAGMVVGRLEVLGELHWLVAPPSARGLVVERGGDPARSRRAVGYGDVLLVLDPSAANVGAAELVAEAAGAESTGLVFGAPTSGRFYARPAPNKPPFVAAGDMVSVGQTVAILEVMKTFNRVQYGGAGMPPRARVVRVVPNEGDDLDAGAPMLELASEE